jgi:hypothetical protein
MNTDRLFAIDIHAHPDESKSLLVCMKFHQ